MNRNVSILVLLEFCLWEARSCKIDCPEKVSILVLLEFCLWVEIKMMIILLKRVSILVLLEFCLWVYWSRDGKSGTRVSILVLLEFCLWDIAGSATTLRSGGFNPCFIGILSVRVFSLRGAARDTTVSILVLLEFCLWDFIVININLWIKFQSLFYWNSVCEREWLKCAFEPASFQSLFYWNSVCEILISLWEIRQECFNPCFIGILSVSYLQ